MIHPGKYFFLWQEKVNLKKDSQKKKIKCYFKRVGKPTFLMWVFNVNENHLFICLIQMLLL